MPDTPSGYHKNFTGCLIDSNGTERHFINGAYGRDGDLPSVIHPDGTTLHYKENPKRGGFGQVAAILHRDGDLPAYTRANGDCFYYKDGKLHRENDLPAIILHDGKKKWYTMGNCYAYQMPGQERKTPM